MRISASELGAPGPAGRPFCLFPVQSGHRGWTRPGRAV